MRILLLLMLVITNVCFAFSQDKWYKTRAKALDVGVYDARNVKKYKVFFDDEAEKEFKKVLDKDEELRKKHCYEVVDENGNVSYESEEIIEEYCPELGIVVITGGHGYVSVYDIKNKISAYGSPSTYAYSPSGKYRFSGIYNDGMEYFLEEKVNGKYVLIRNVGLGGNIHGVYWIDEKTIYYLSEKQKSDGSKYWIAYSAQFYPVTTP